MKSLILPFLYIGAFFCVFVPFMILYEMAVDILLEGIGALYVYLRKRFSK